MHWSLSCSTTPSSLRVKQSTGHTAMQGASEQCMQATEIERSPGSPSFRVTTPRRLTPQGTSFAFLQAVTQALHSMHRLASQMNFMRAILSLLVSSRGLSGRLSNLAQRALRSFLHHRHRVVSIGRAGVDRLTTNDRRCPGRIAVDQILALPPPGEVERQEHRIRSDPLGDQGLDLELRAGRGADPDEFTVANAAIISSFRIDFDEHVLLQLGQPGIGGLLRP